jgi:hypothetical protein
MTSSDVGVRIDPDLVQHEAVPVRERPAAPRPARRVVRADPSGGRAAPVVRAPRDRLTPGGAHHEPVPALDRTTAP